jgi:DNA modification methylase
VTWLDRIHVGDCRALMRQMIDAGVRVNCIVTSPPYFGLRDYGHDDQIGLEASPAEYVDELVSVFQLARQLLADDGTLWLNLGDSYAGSGRGGYPGGKSGLDGSIDGQNESRAAREKITGRTAREAAVTQRGSRLPAGFHEKARLAGTLSRAWCPPPVGFKQKDLIGIPWRVAFALQADGWYLRQDIIWSKPNPMPESVRDRCTKSHEYLFLLAKSGEPTIWRAADTGEWSKSPDLSQEISWPTDEEPGGTRARWRGFDYYFNADAIAEDAVSTSPAGNGFAGRQGGATHLPMSGGTGTAEPWKPGSKRNSFARETKESDGDHGQKPQHRPDRKLVDYSGRRNKRSVWTITTKPFAGAHFATFPPDLVEPCVLAGTPPSGVVFDPFMGSGTVAEVALSLGRHFIGCELNPDYAALFESHRSGQVGMAL